MDIHTLHIEHVVLQALYTLLTVANSWLYKGIKGSAGSPSLTYLLFSVPSLSP